MKHSILYFLKILPLENNFEFMGVKVSLVDFVWINNNKKKMVSRGGVSRTERVLSKPLPTSRESLIKNYAKG